MTREQAIRILKTKRSEPCTDWQYAEALSIAISALKHPIFECEGKTYIGENLVLKTIDYKGICSFYGFREVEE